MVTQEHTFGLAMSAYMKNRHALCQEIGSTHAVYVGWEEHIPCSLDLAEIS